MKADEILRRAAELVGGERAQQHGNMHETFDYTARLWSAYLNFSIDPADVAWMMVLLKMARNGTGSPTIENPLDAAGYAAIAGQLASEGAKK